MRFHASEAAPVDEGENGDSVHFDEVDLAGFDGVDEIDESRFTDRLLDTNLGTDALQKRLLQLARDARTAEEEQGINILFLALGFLAWFEDERSDVPREAPLILVPVELVRNERTSTYDIRAREEDIVTNLPLQSRLREDFGLTLPEIEDEDEWSPSVYFDAVRSAGSAIFVLNSTRDTPTNEKSCRRSVARSNRAGRKCRRTSTRPNCASNGTN